MNDPAIDAIRREARDVLGRFVNIEGTAFDLHLALDAQVVIDRLLAAFDQVVQERDEALARQGCRCRCCDHGAGSDCGCQCHATGLCSSDPEGHPLRVTALSTEGVGAVKRYQMVYPSGIRVAAAPPQTNEVKTVTVWEAAYGEWVRYADLDALLTEVQAVAEEMRAELSLSPHLPKLTQRAIGRWRDRLTAAIQREG